MAKYYGIVGYAIDEETSPGVWQNKIIEKPIFGEYIRNSKITENPGQVNDNIKVNIQISFIADPYAMDNFHQIKYATYLGSKWKVSNVDPSNYPRLWLTLGDLYNG